MMHTAMEGLFLLGISSYSSATILPGSSEVVLATFLHHYPHYAVLAFIVATFFNTLGSMTMLIVGRIIPNRKKHNPKVEAFVDKYGTWSLLFAGVPVVGDLLPIAAGWFRLNLWQSFFMILIGKSVRYLLVLGFLEFILKHFWT